MAGRLPVLSIVYLCLGAAIAHAAPVLSVRARSAVVVDSVERSADGIAVRGRVVDANSSQPLPDADVRILVGEETVGLGRADSTGEFAILVPTDRERLVIEVRAEGEGLGPSTTGPIEHRVSRRPLTLALDSPEVKSDRVLVGIRAQAGAEPASRVRMEIRVGDQVVGRITTDHVGEGAVELRRDTGPLAKLGRFVLTASFPGNRLYEPASASVGLMLDTSTQLSLQSNTSKLAASSRVELKAILIDDSSQAVRGARVDLTTGAGETLASAETDESGTVQFRVDADELGTGVSMVQAVFESPLPWLRSSRSEAVAIEVLAPTPIPTSYTLLAFAATLLALLAFIALRTKPWLRWVATAEDKENEDESRTKRPVRGGLRQARSSIAQSLRRAHRRDFSAIVVDAVTGHAIANATVELRSGDRTRSGRSGDDGTVLFDELDDGPWRGTVVATFYVRETFEFVVPHHGELSGARLELVAVRERIFDRYKVAAEPNLPQTGLWGLWTPRQIVDHVRENSGDAPALTALTVFVEDAYFSQRTPREEALAECDQRVDLAVAERLARATVRAAKDDGL